MPVHSAYQPKPESKTGKTRKAPARTVESEPGLASAAKPTVSKKLKKPQLEPEERKEHSRARAAENRKRRKAMGLCKDCPNQAIAGQSRCSSCAEKNRQRHSRHMAMSSTVEG